MKLRSNILIIILPVILITTLLFCLWSYISTKNTIHSVVDKSLTSFIVGYINHDLQPNLDLLKLGNLGDIEALSAKEKKEASRSIADIETPWPTHNMIYDSQGHYINCNMVINDKSFRVNWGKEVKRYGNVAKESFSGSFVVNGVKWFHKTIKFTPLSWYITIAVKDSDIQHEAIEYLKKSVIIILLLSIVVTFIILSYFKINIINPLNQLINYVDNFSSSNPLQSTGVAKDNIIGKLARNIELSASKIKKHESEMCELNSSLELKYKRIHNDLLNNEKKYRRLFQNMLNGCAYHRIILEDNVPVDYLFLEVNSAFEKQTGLVAKDIIGKKVTEIIPGINDTDPDLITEYSRVAMNGDVVDFVHHSHALNKYYHVKAFQVEEYYFAVTIDDITEETNSKNKILEHNVALDKSIQEETAKRLMSEQFMLENKKFVEMGQLISSIAHQWRQPLNALGLYIQDIDEANKYNELNDDYIKDMIENSMTQINGMSEVIDDFMHYFLPKETQEKIFVAKLVIETFKLISSKLSSRGINYKITCSCHTKMCDIVGGNLPTCDIAYVYIVGYESEFKQVILNIIYNAIDAIDEKQIMTSGYDAEIHLNIRYLGDNIVVEIKDNGTSLLPENITRVFDPYFSTKDEGRGTGIGLYMSKNIIKTHMGGELQVKVEGEFKIFIISLPALVGEKNEN